MERDQEKQDPKRKLNPPPSPPPGSSSGATEAKADNAAAKREDVQEPKRKRWFSKPRRRFVRYTLNIITVILGFYLLTQTRRQADISSDTLQFQRESTALNGIEQRRTNDSTIAVAKKAVAIAESSITLSKSIADNQERFAKIEVRPYVNISTIDPPDLSIGDSITVQIKWVNSGRTPAYLLGGRYSTMIGGGIDRDDIKRLENMKVGELDRKTIAPNTTANQTIQGIVWTRQDSIAFYSKKCSLYIFGTLFYTDKFSENHSTSWSYSNTAPDRIWKTYPLYNNAN